MPDPLTCQELVELVTDYLEGAMPAAESARFEAHLAGCDGCEGYVRQMRETIVLLGTLPADPLSPAAEEHLRAAFRDWRSGPARHS